MFDLEMLEQMGFCSGIENYSRWLSGRKPGEPPPCLLDYFPKDFLLVIDESHQTVPADRRACTGATARARRPWSSTASGSPRRSTTGRCKFEEFERLCRPGHLRLGHAGRVRAAEGRRAWWWSRSSAPPAWSTRRWRSGRWARQVDDLLGEMRKRAEAGRAGAGHHPHQAHGRGPDRVLHRRGRALPLPARRHRDPGAERAHPRPAPRRVRRAHRHQPAARGARHPRGLAGGDPRRRQGGLPALRGLADPDHRPGRAQRERPGHPLRRLGHRLDAAGPSTRPTGGARCSGATTRSTASRRSR